MSRSIIIHESAELELAESVEFYNKESLGLGAQFIDEIDETIQLIAAFPESSPVIRGKVRCKPLKKFPYTLIYSLRPTEIRILAVSHQKRRPYYWHLRH